MPSFSASRLVKHSARQLRKAMLEKVCKKPGERFFALPATTKAQEDGNNFAESKIKSPYVEMSGHVFNRVKGRENLAFSLYFSIDEVRRSRGYLSLYEYKSIQGEFESWYLENSLIQAALYTALTRRVSCLKTAAFRQQQGHPLYSIDVDRPVAGKLQFGENLYRVTCSDEQLLIRFFFTKARAVIHSWERAEQFDATYKHKEWEFLKSIIHKRKS